MNLKQLESLVWIARLGGFSAAAGKLNTTQPAISQRIRELETDLGVILINRSHRSLSLTPKGRECVEFAERLLDLASDLQARIGSKDSISGRARVGVGESIALTWLPELLSILGAEYPHLSVDLVVDITKPLCRGLETGDYDVIILGGADLTTQCKVVDLGKADLAWLAKPDGTVWKRPATAHDLQARRILMLTQETLLNRTAEDWFLRQGAEPSQRDLCNSMTVLAALTMAGRGISLLPPKVFQRDIAEGRLCVIPTEPPVEPVQYRAIYRPLHWPPFGRIIAELAQSVSIFDRDVVKAPRPRPHRPASLDSARRKKASAR